MCLRQVSLYVVSECDDSIPSLQDGVERVCARDELTARLAADKLAKEIARPLIQYSLKTQARLPRIPPNPKARPRQIAPTPSDTDESQLIPSYGPLD